MELQKAERYADAARYWGIIAAFYTNTTFYAASLSQLSFCSGKLGDKEKEIGYLTTYLPVETVPIRRLQAQFRLVYASSSRAPTPAAIVMLFTL